MNSTTEEVSVNVLVSEELPIDETTTWENVSSTDGSSVHARHEAGGAVVGGKIYVIGGRGRRPVDRFDPAKSLWAHFDRPSLEMNHFQPVAVYGQIYVIGAFTGTFPLETSISRVRIYEPEKDRWSDGPLIPADRQRGSAGAAVYQGKIYIVGGNTRGHSGGAVAWLDQFDPQTGMWTRLPDAPHARDHVTVAIAGDYLVVAGGRQSDYPDTRSKTVAATDVYNFQTGEWKTADDIPTLRAGAMAVTHGNEVVIIGGETEAIQAHDEVESFNVLTQQWRKLQSLTTPRHGGIAASIGGNLHIISGNTTRGGGNETTAHESLQLPSTNLP